MVLSSAVRNTGFALDMSYTDCYLKSVRAVQLLSQVNVSVTHLVQQTTHMDENWHFLFYKPTENLVNI